MTNYIFDSQNISKRYETSEVVVDALANASFSIEEGEFVVIVGPSGSGKSTLLNILGGMDVPTAGVLLYKGNDIGLYNEQQLTFYRKECVGFVFQFYNLMPNLTVYENIELSTAISQNPLDILETLKNVGLEGYEDFFPSQLSGGQQQRVAIARAVAKNPDILLCDEPTGALDFETGIQVLDLLKTINITTKKTVIIITHNQPIASMANIVLKMRSGKIIDTIKNESPLNVRELEW